MELGLGFFRWNSGGGVGVGSGTGPFNADGFLSSGGGVRPRSRLASTESETEVSSYSGSGGKIGKRLPGQVGCVLNVLCRNQIKYLHVSPAKGCHNCLIGQPAPLLNAAKATPL
ncbi:unnamed protein product [Spirodela intermedia]|uniref:Uncharacterized protein n=1 Tax=Spirodela intermedia TaxID=51605 RepID=A0A7I8JRN3_SPIIN|nr:unnamed protein product [Spirodela intermedia]CAA6672082.1 unnamed protein product [Spirodela intermedia]